MKTVPSRKKLLVLGALVAVALCGVYGALRLRSSAQPASQDETPRPILLGRVTLPPLAGWSQRFSGGLRADTVIYKKSSAGCDLNIGVTWQKSSKNVPPPLNVQDLLRRANYDLQWSQAMIRRIDQRQRHAPGSSAQATSPTITTYSGLPAVSTQATSRTSKGATNDIRGTRFLLNGQEFRVDERTSHPSGENPTPQAAAEMKSALHAIEQAFEAAKTAGK